MKISPYQRIRRFVSVVFFLLFPVTITMFSPYLSVLGAYSGIITGSVLVFCVFFLASPFFGRAFCSWICPAGHFQDQLATIRTQKAGKAGRWWFKYLVWAPWLLALLVGLVLSLLSQPTGLTFNFWWEPSDPLDLVLEPYSPLINLGGHLLLTYMIFLVFMIPSLILGQRGGCHTLCWMSPFMVLGRKLGNVLRLPAIRLKAQPERCIHCSLCSRTCPAGIPVQQLVEKANTEHSECILCGQCVDACPKNVLSIKIAQ